jgi:hypothetical protein
MNNSENEIENILRRAPKPSPPADLKDRLVAGVRLSTTGPSPTGTGAKFAPTGWWRRWWPTLLPAAGSLACAVVFSVQQAELRDLRTGLDALSERSAAAQEAPASVPATTRGAIATKVESLTPEQEIDHLRQVVKDLQAEVTQLSQKRAENQKLRADLLAATAGGLTAEEADAMNTAREHAMSINCINNLKQFGLAVRIWANDNGEINPPNIVVMSNELSNAKILICPADKGRVAATDFATFTTANCSYEYLAPSGSTDEPMRVLSRCPVHGHIGLCDGSVQSNVAKNHPESLIYREGKLYYDYKATMTPPTHQSPDAPANPANP